MINLKKLINIFVIIAAMTLSSCGYLSDKPPVNVDVYKVDQLQGCKIDINKLGEIFKADQKEQIRCLQENFIQFTKYVRSTNPDSVSETELNAFIRKFFQGQSESIVKGLSLLFQLNMILLRDEADRISRTNISPLFELLVQVNQEAIIITQILKDMSVAENQGRFWELREKFRASVTRFSESTLKIIAKSPGVQKQLNIKQFVLDMSSKLGNRQVDPELVESFVFVKRMLAAGDRDIITSDELNAIIAKLPKVMSLCFDLYYVKGTNFANEAEHSRFYMMNVRDVYSIINFNQNDFDLVTVDQIIKVLQEFYKDFDFSKFKPSVVALKTRLIGGAAEKFTLKDLHKFLDMGNDLSEKLYFDQVTYNAYRNLLEKTDPLKNIPELDLPYQYDVFSKRRVSELHAEFNETLNNYRYFRNTKTGSGIYGNEIIRNKYGFIEMNIIRWLSTKLLNGYGHPNPDGIQQVNVEEFRKFLYDIKPILVEFKLWAPNPDSFVKNAVLLADLFQNQSNGDLEINAVEATEYVQMILSSSDIAERFNKELVNKCDGGINKDDPLFETECYNQHFYQTLLSDLDYKTSMPRLNQYVQTVTPEESAEYLTGVEGFARDSADPKIPINKRDNILILGAMINIETTFLRFDTNRDNIIDYDELVEAFRVYKKGIISMANLKPSQEAYAQSIFMYMVSKMEIPPTGTWLQSAKFFSFHQCLSWSFCRKTVLHKIEAKRLNVGKLLYYMVNQNTPSPTQAQRKKELQLSVNE